MRLNTFWPSEIAVSVSGLDLKKKTTIFREYEKNVLNVFFPKSFFARSSFTWTAVIQLDAIYTILVAYIFLLSANTSLYDYLETVSPTHPHTIFGAYRYTAAHISIPLAIVSTTHLCTLVLKHHLHKASREQSNPPSLHREKHTVQWSSSPAWRRASGDKVCGWTLRVVNGGMASDGVKG